MEIYDRIRCLRKDVLSLSQTEFGNKLGVSRSVIANMELNLLAKPEQKEPLYRLICKTFNISEAWLRDGLEPMELPPNEDFSFLIDQVLAGESETAKALSKVLTKLDKSDWQALRKIIDKIKE